MKVAGTNHHRWRVHWQDCHRQDIPSLHQTCIKPDAMTKSFPVGAPPAPFCGIAVMAKASLEGRTKTRLVPPLTYKEAAAFNTAFLQDMAADILAASRLASLRGYMAFGPPDAIP